LTDRRPPLNPTAVRWIPRAAFVGALLLATLPPPVFDLTRAGILARLAGAFDLTFAGSDVVDAVRNLLLFAGWGAVWAVTAERQGAGMDARHSARRVVGGATVTGALLSVSVELIQLLSPFRDTAVWDFITNTTGSALGAAVLVVAIGAVARFRQGPFYVGLPAFVLAGGYGAAVLLEAMFPLLQQGTIPGSGGGVVVRAARALDHFSWDTLRDVELLNLILFFPAGAFAVAALAESGVERVHAARWVAGVSIPLFTLVELAGGVAGQPLSAGAVPWNALSATLGAALTARFLPAFTRRWRGADRPRLLLAVYLVVLLLWSLRPFTFVTSMAALADGLTLEQLRPLRAHAQRFDLFSAIDIVRQFALLAPLGGILAVWPLRRSGLLQGPLPAIAVAVLLEAGQLLVDGRLFDMTDALVGAAAVTLGWVVVRQAGMRPWGELLPPRRPPPSTSRPGTG
jgi:glycopeptide antibiotics resistance protein